MSRRSAVCGTRSAYHRHLRLKETPCSPCKAAEADYRAEYLARNPLAYQRQLARTRALNQLRRMFPDEFTRLRNAAARSIEHEDGTPRQKADRARGRALLTLAELHRAEHGALLAAEFAKLDQAVA